MHRALCGYCNRPLRLRLLLLVAVEVAVRLAVVGQAEGGAAHRYTSSLLQRQQRQYLCYSSLYCYQRRLLCHCRHCCRHCH